MTKRKRSLLMSVMTLMLCLALVAGGTYALFTDQVTLGTHLEAGNLDITLKRINLDTKMLGEDGFLHDLSSRRVVDFTNPTRENVFDIHEDHLVVPCSSYTATMKIENHSSVAFKYWVEIVHGTGDEALLSQIQIRVEDSDGNYTEHRLSKGSTLGSEAYPIDILAVDESDTFKISILFVDDRVDTSITNNHAMNQNLHFDVKVHAVQVTERPTPPTP